MTLPGDLSTTAVSGRFLDAAGKPRTGSVTFTPSNELTDATGLVIITMKPVTAGIGSDGSFTVTLASTSNVTLLPAGWSYQVTVILDGQEDQQFSCYLPASPSAVDITALVPLTSVAPVTPYLTAQGGTLWGPLVLGAGLKIPSGAAAGEFLTCDAAGNATWAPVSIGSVGAVNSIGLEDTTGQLRGGLISISGDLWLLSNAYWDTVAQEFYRIDITKASYGYQLQGQGYIPGEPDLGYYVSGATLWVAQPESYTLIRGGGNPSGARFTATGGWELGFTVTQQRQMTVGGGGIEIDGYGTYPYTRVVANTTGSVFSRHLSGMSRNVYTDFSSADDTTQESWFWGYTDQFTGGGVTSGSNHWTVAYIPAANWPYGSTFNEYLTVSAAGVVQVSADPTTSLGVATKHYVDTAVGGGSTSQALTPAGLKTSAYTAAAGDFVPVSTASAAVTITLPNAPAAGTIVGVKLAVLGGTNAVTVARNGSGTDVFNVSGGSTSLTLTRLFQTVVMVYSGGIWYVTSTDPAIALDTTSTDIAALGTQAAGSAGKAADAGHVHPTTGLATSSALTTETSRATTAEALLAPLASPALTGTPTAPTKTALTNNTDIATTAYADAAVAAETSRAGTAEALKAPLASPALTGSPTAPTQTTGDSSTKIATDAFVATAVTAETTRATAAEALALPLAGGTMSGAVAMGSHKVTGLTDGTAASDAAAFGQIPDWINVTSATYGADSSGGTDTGTAIGGAITAASSGQTVYLPAGTYLLNGSGFLTLATAGVRLIGDGPKATIIKIGASFTGAQAVYLNAEGCAVENMTITGTSTTTTSNPAADAIYLAGRRFNRLNNVEFEYINGWCVNEVATSTQAPYGSMFTNLSTYRNCAGGIHVKSNTSVTWGAQVFLDNINMQQIGVGSGTNANLDAFFFEDCFDVTASNFNAGISDASTGSTLHILGNCASHYFTNMDLGCFPNASSGTNSVITIESGTNGHPSDIRFVQGCAQQGQTGLTISGTSAKISFNSFRFFNNYSDGARVTGTGSDIRFSLCSWDLNGQGASGTNYDLNWSGTATGAVYTSKYFTPLVTTGTAGVQYTVNLPSAGVQVPHFLTDFGGSGSGIANWFTHVPSLNVRSDTSPPSWAGRLSLSSGQGSNYGLLVTNTTTAPTVPYTQFAAKTALDQTLGVAVTNDTQQRLLIDSNGKHSWGTGSATQDTTLYRNGAGILKTDGVLQTGNAAAAGFTPSNPATTVSTTLVMMGLGTTIAFTPAGSGNVHVTLTGYAHTATAAVGISVAPRYGTGTAPSNGAAVTGTRFGPAGDPQLQSGGPTREAGFAFTAILALTAGTAYWFDVGTDTTSASDAATITNVSCTIAEL